MNLFQRIILTLAFAGLPAGVFALGVGEAMPAINGPRLDAADSSLAADALRGQVVYVDFWASWCGPCRRSMPIIDGLARKHAGAGFRVIGVNKDVREADARRFLEQVKVDFPLVQDEGDKLARAFGVKAMPSGYLVDRKGVVRFVHRGYNPNNTSAIEAEIQSLLAESP
jgi:thiol-disulfide isomerase/thioredoxin